MLTETLTFEDLLASLKTAFDDRSRTAIAYFQEKKLSLGKAAELAGLNPVALYGHARPSTCDFSIMMNLCRKRIARRFAINRRRAMIISNATPLIAFARIHQLDITCSHVPQLLFRKPLPNHCAFLY